LFKTRVGESLIDLRRYSEAKELLSRLLSDLELLGRLRVRWVDGLNFYATSGLARIEHEQNEWRKAAEKWRVALDHANAVGRNTYNSIPAYLARISHDDAIWELSGAREELEEKQRLKDVLDVIKPLQEKGFNKAMFYHWVGYLVEKLESRIMRMEEASTLTDNAEERSLSQFAQLPPILNHPKPKFPVVPLHAHVGGSLAQVKVGSSVVRGISDR
jgi:hypothetical protein